jgi:hypothetical protein
MIHSIRFCPTKIAPVAPYFPASLNMLGFRVLCPLCACLARPTTRLTGLLYFGMITAISPKGFSYLFCVFRIVLPTIGRAFCGMRLSILPVVYHLLCVGFLVILFRLLFAPLPHNGVRGISLSVIIPLALLTPISISVWSPRVVMEII